MKRKMIGILLAVCGNSLISFSLNAQKYAHMINQQRPEHLRVSYLQMKWWWIGMVMMAFGELGNFLAFGFAPASLVSPLGGVSVIANAFIASGLLGEILLVRDVIGTTFALLGGIVIVVFAPEDDPNMTMPILMEYALSSSFLLFLFVIVLSVAFLMKLPKEVAEKHLVVNILICSLLGCITVMTCKGISVSLFLTMQGQNQFRYPFIYVLLLTAISTIVLQIKHLNEAMKLFGTAQVVPVYYVLFTMCAIMGGMMLYKEFLYLTGTEIASFACGCCITFFGIFVITANRKPRISDAGSIDKREAHPIELEFLNAKHDDPMEQRYLSSYDPHQEHTTHRETSISNIRWQRIQDLLNTPVGTAIKRLR